MARSPLMVFGLVVALVALPATGTLMYAQITGDHSVRPMSLSASAVRSRLFGSSGAVEAQITVSGNGLTPAQKTALEDQITLAFKRREVPVDIQFKQSAQATESSIIYRIGNSKVGPLPLRRASEGVRSAVDAYRLSF